MNPLKLNKRKGVAGLDIFLSLIVMLFMIGLIVMVFALAGDSLTDAVDDDTSKQIINDTVNSLSTAVDWNDTFIVLGAMVVLILLVVIVVRAIRGSGMVGGETA